MCLVSDGSDDFVFIFHLGLHHVPAHADGLVGQGDHLLLGFGRTNYYIAAIGVVLGRRHVELVITFGHFLHQDGAFGAGDQLADDAACVVVAQFDGGVAHVGVVAVLGAVDGVFVAHLDAERTRDLAYHLDAERNGDAVAVLAVDADAAALDNVDVIVGVGIEAEHDGGGVARGERRHLGGSGQRNEVAKARRQADADFTRLGYARIGH